MPGALVLNLRSGRDRGFSAEHHVEVLAATHRVSPHDIIVDTAQASPERERDQLRRAAVRRKHRFSSLTFPDLVHLYMTRAKLAAALKVYLWGNPAREWRQSGR